MSVCENIRKWRSLRRMTMPQLAEKAGVTAQAVFMWEKGKSVPTRAEIEAVAAALDVRPSEISGAPQPARVGAPHATEAAGDADVGHAHLYDEIRPGFDMTLITRVYHMAKDESGSASLLELTTAWNLLQESLRLLKTRLDEMENENGDRP